MPAPVSGPITQGFGEDESGLGFPGLTTNKGLDYGVPVGTKVSAVRGGIVIAVGDDSAGWGIRVVIRDKEGNVHSYAHS